MLTSPRGSHESSPSSRADSVISHRSVWERALFRILTSIFRMVSVRACQKANQDQVIYRPETQTYSAPRSAITASARAIAVWEWRREKWESSCRRTRSNSAISCALRGPDFSYLQMSLKAGESVTGVPKEGKSKDSTRSADHASR